MRYSMLVYLVQMGRTLMEAAEYLSATPEDDPLRSELLGNGRQMLIQIREELNRHRQDLCSQYLFEALDTIECLWEIGGTKLTATLEEFVHRLPSEIQYQVRAVFFAGLGSTWDSMESVYEYMREDPRFDPVVVLMPIIRHIQQDGQERHEIIYTDYLTPMGIPFLEWKKYRLEDDCPELAFTCQPYRGVVLPDFYPEVIAKYTRLVYLPYYLPDMEYNESMEALCGLGVYHHAWKVICPSEKVYEYYCRHAVNGGSNGLLTGVPKLDHLVTLRERGIALPKGWERLRGKKVFLWNTWYDVNVSSLRQFDEIVGWFSDKMDCTLIWRPHPMTAVVMRVNYPNLYPVYMDYIQRIQSMPNAILDQEVSYEAAFFYSNAMISDFSSMQPQYLLMDKPDCWVKNNSWQLTGEEFIESRWMEQAETIDDIFAFMERIRNDEDYNAGIRRTIREQDLPLADGHCGERVCETVWDILHLETL